ncbi:MAG TPA: hypothetical protein DDW85_02320 [Porphyromonadaceae bacterium]|nr:hypothetical protein [Porphyromonadaceae bacterium]
MSSIAIIVCVFLILVVCVLKFSSFFYPDRPLKAGDQVSIYLDNKYNRTATISDISSNQIAIYDKLYLPVSYTGKFYCAYYRASRSILYCRKRYFHLVKIAEALRKFKVGKGTGEIDEEDEFDELDDF